MAVESPDPQEQQLDTSTHSLKASNSESQTMSESGPMANTSENPINGIHSVNGVTSGGPAGHNVTEAQQQQQVQQAPMANGVPHGYPYPPPPGSGYPVGPPPEMFQQGDSGASGPRMMQPVPYPYPPQPGHQGPPGPPTGYVYPTMMAPPPPPAGGVSPSSPTSAMSMPYGYGMWYPPPPGMPMQPPPGMMPPQNGMHPMPVPMGAYPPNGYPPSAQTNGDNKPSSEGNADPQQQQQQAQVNGQSGTISWVPGPGGLPPKEVAKNIPCRYFPDCRFGASCWFLHPGSDVHNGQHANAGDKQPDGQPPRAFFQGPLPPPVQYGPSGPWDPSSSTPAPNSNQSDPGKSPYPSQNGTPAPSGYGLMYAPYPYGPNGYPHMYPVPPHLQQQQQANVNPAASPSQAPQVPPQPSPHDHAQNLQQNPQSLHSTPHGNSPSPNPPVQPPMYPMNGAGWYPPPGPYPPPNMQPGAMNHQPMSPGQTVPGSLPISPVSPPQGSNPLAMNMPPSMSPMGAPNVPPQPMQQSGPPGPIPYPISPPYTNAPLQPRSPHQNMPPLSPPNHPGSPPGVYGGQPPVPPVMPHGHHSRRESMSSMSAVPMGTVLGPHLDGNPNMEGSRSPPSSAFRDMGDGVGRRPRGGHSNRGSWSSTGGFGSSSRKPPCAFYPQGKCKNGDLCRFPHIMPDENAPISPISPRGGYSGSFGRTSRRPTILGPIEDKLAEMSVKEDGPAENGDAVPRQSGSSKPYNNSSPKMRGGRAPTSTPSTPIHRQNNHNQHNQPPANQQPAQKLPSADDFPVLGGTATPPHSHGNGQPYGSAWGGPTAAQVLKGSITGNKKAPAPVTANGVAGDSAKEFKAGSEEEQSAE